MLALFLEILGILTPAATLAVVGVVWAKLGYDYPITFVTRIVMNVAMPALLFHTLATSAIPLSSLGSMVVATLLVHLVFLSVAVLLLKRSEKDWRLSIALVLGNTGNLGLPVCYFAYGDTGLAYAMTFFSVQCLMLFSVGDALLAGSTNILRTLKSPILHSIWIGAMVRYFEWQVPKVVLDTTELTGDLAIPIMLITLGVSLASMKVNTLPSTIRWSIVRTVLAVAIGSVVAMLLGLDGVARGVLILETTMPVAVFNYLMAVRHNRETTEVSGMILVTHLSAIVYLPVLLAVLLSLP